MRVNESVSLMYSVPWNGYEYSYICIVIRLALVLMVVGSVLRRASMSLVPLASLIATFSRMFQLVFQGVNEA